MSEIESHDDENESKKTDKIFINFKLKVIITNSCKLKSSTSLSYTLWAIGTQQYWVNGVKKRKEHKHRQNKKNP